MAAQKIGDCRKRKQGRLLRQNLTRNLERRKKEEKIEEVICRINPANSVLFAGLIWQIMSYLPDYENFVRVHMVLYGTGVRNQE